MEFKTFFTSRLFTTVILSFQICFVSLLFETSIAIAAPEISHTHFLTSKKIGFSLPSRKYRFSNWEKLTKGLNSFQKNRIANWIAFEELESIDREFDWQLEPKPPSFRSLLF